MYNLNRDTFICGIRDTEQYHQSNKVKMCYSDQWNVECDRVIIIGFDNLQCKVI